MEKGGLVDPKNIRSVFGEMMPRYFKKNRICPKICIASKMALIEISRSFKIQMCRMLRRNKYN